MLCFLTIFYLCNVTDYDLSHWDLNNLSSTDNGEFLLLLNAALEAPELLLFTPVVERRHQHHADDGEENGGALDPACLRLVFILYTTSCPSTVCGGTGNRNSWTTIK